MIQNESHKCSSPLTSWKEEIVSASSGSRFLSLFSGAGGLDVGLESAGWHCVGQLDSDPDSVETLRRRTKNSLAPIPVIEAAIEEVGLDEIEDHLGIGPGEIDLIAGGPPCQPFTTSGLRQGISDRRAVDLFPAYLRLLNHFRPRSIAIENVDGLLSAATRHRPLRQRTKMHPPLDPDEKKGSFLLWFLTQLADLGYHVSWGVVEAADYGAAQFRQRALLLGRLDVAPMLPEATHGGEGQPAFRSLAEALAEVSETGPIQPLSQKKRSVYSQIPAGGNWRDLPDELQRDTMGAAYYAEGGRSGWWRRLSWSEPAPTILGMPDHSSTALIHPDEVRCLSVRECAAVQGFEPSTEFAGSPRSQYQQIGNAVPVQLGLAIGRHLLRAESTEVRVPSPPVWRKSSANRRIGTHGWVEPGPNAHTFNILVKPRPDHVWVGDLDPHHRHIHS